MKKYQNILTVIDPSVEDQKALKRSIELANHTQANITAFLTIFDFSYEMTTMLSSDERESMRNSVIDDRQQWLNNMINRLNTQGLTINTKVVWHNRPFEAVIHEVLDHDHDIVIKGTHEHDKLKSVIFTPTDWHILRKCPCPVLLVKDHLWPEQGNIVAAINVGSDEDEHISLNDKITAQANDLAKAINANVHIVNSYPGTPINIAIEIPEFNSINYNSSMLKHHQDAMSVHCNKYNIPDENTHVLEGLPEDVIQAVANKLDAELVILGTIGRTGLSAALIGNTAEHVIDKLNCDVLALKPDGYISPFAQ